jgi:hypothetical protein
MKAYPFLHKHPTTGETTLAQGMDLRDWFAAHAMQGMCSYDNLQKYRDIVEEAYLVADLMIKQREMKHE